jgi:hypothetical protein
MQNMLLSLFREKHVNPSRAIEMRIIVKESVSSSLTKYNGHSLSSILFSPNGRSIIHIDTQSLTRACFRTHIHTHTRAREIPYLLWTRSFIPILEDISYLTLLWAYWSYCTSPPQTYIFIFLPLFPGRLSGLVVRVPGWRHRGPGFDSLRYQIFWVAVDLEELLERKVAAPV